MIKLEINITTNDIVSNIAKYNRDVSDSLQKIAKLIPKHKSDDFNSSLWGKFKISIWNQQSQKCAFCEKEIMSSDDAQLEHFRPRAEARTINNELITRESYWWLAYELKNYIVSCFTCNNLKGNRFPITDENTRVKATDINWVIDLTDDGVLKSEIPYLINPRYQNPEPYLAYNYSPFTRMVFIEHKDGNDIGEKTIDILDLNRKRKNVEVVKDLLPHKRGIVLSEFKKELEVFNVSRSKLLEYRSAMVAMPNKDDMKSLVDAHQAEVNKKRDNIRERFLSKRAQFSGMCSFWLKTDTDLECYFIEQAV